MRRIILWIVEYKEAGIHSLPIEILGFPSCNGLDERETKMLTLWDDWLITTHNTSSLWVVGIVIDMIWPEPQQEAVDFLWWQFREFDWSFSVVCCLLLLRVWVRKKSFSCKSVSFLSVNSQFLIIAKRVFSLEIITGLILVHPWKGYSLKRLLPLQEHVPLHKDSLTPPLCVRGLAVGKTNKTKREF